MNNKIVPMDQDLWCILSKHRDSTDGYTHVSQLHGYQGRYRIERSEEENMWDAYCRAVLKNNIVSMSERPGELQPLRIDGDFKVLKPSGHTYDMDKTLKHLYTLDDLKIIIKVYQRVIKEISKTFKPRNSVCLLLEKKHPYSTMTEIKNGFHVHFPLLWCRDCDHDNYIIPKVKKYLNEGFPELFKSVGVANPSDVIDPKVFDKHWLMYGSYKEERTGTYLFTRAFDSNANEIELATALADFKLTDVSENPIPITAQNIVFNLPRILSIEKNKFLINGCQQLLIKPGIECLVKQSVATVKEKNIKHENLNITEAVQMAKELVPLLSSTRADDYSSWMQIGWALYNIGDGCQESLELWISFSSRATRQGTFDESQCIHSWQKMVNTGKFSIGTLRHYASVDNPEAFDKWRKSKSSNIIKDALGGGHFDMAKLLFTYYGSSFCYCPIDERAGKWFEYINHRWEYSPQGLSLKSKLTGEILNRIQEEHKKLKHVTENNGELEEEETDEDQHKFLTDQRKKYTKVIGNLKSAPFKSNVLKESCELFRNVGFLGKLDNDIDLMGFNNGVLDLKEKTFRPGRPSDYISMTTGYDYKDDYTWTSPEVVEVMSFLDKIFPDYLLKTYYIEYSAQLLKGGNFRKIFVNMVGSGDNGKSVLIDLMEKTLGQYMIKFPTSLLTGKRNASSSASPELARSQGVRFAVLQEPSKKDTLNEGLLKELTGNDTFYCRGLFKDGGEIVPQFKVALIANKLPRLGDDQAAWNRIEVLPFEAKFPKNPRDVPDKLEDQIRTKTFPRDESMSERLIFMKQPFMWILFQKFKEISQRGLSEKPGKVIAATDDYRKRNDVFLKFKTDRIRDEPDQAITPNSVYIDFGRWFSETFPSLSRECPDKDDLVEYLLQKLGPVDENNRWNGYRLRTMRDDIIEKKAVVMTKENLGSSPDDLEVDIKTLGKNEVDEDEDESEPVIHNRLIKKQK